ncbi:protein tramtrack, alpha isoform-like isoform X3 [Ischnura elegans]|uniref:protein tramtrack, alpha isoform-like isoform X3 n=1 Tax=Ischnura elegans TaxID=197161 RepID=UPI001ED876A1|nr:protein tramtrack, alpha isoform-like isoform X3 [Ischnura elegans]
MMAPQQFCVRWNSHQSNLQSAFPKLLTNEHFADVTLACEARSIRCHKVVLSACSAYFESLLVSNPCQHPIVFMKDMRHRDLRALVDFMYRGEVNVSQEELASLLRAAEALQIRGLSGSDQEVAAAPIGSLPTNLPPDISVRNGPIVPSTGQESPPPGSGNGRRSLHKRRRNLGQGGPGSPSGGDSQRSGQRDDGRASDDDVEAVDEEAESPRPRTHGEIQVRGDLHEPSGIDEEGKDEYEEDGGVDLDTVKTEHDYGSQALDNSGAAAGDNEDDLEEEDEEEGESLKIEGDGRPSDPQSMHYHHMLDVPGPSGYTPQTHTPSQEKMMMGVTDPATLALQSVTCEISPGGWPAMGPGMRHIQPMGGMQAVNVQSPTSPSSIPSPASMAGLTNSGTKRIRRSEDELKKAADCVGRGMTFQNVSHIFGIPISTIRFYMARRGILPQRRRGRVQTLRRVVQMGSPGSAMGGAPELHAIAISPQSIAPKVIRTYPAAETKHTPTYHQ